LHQSHHLPVDTMCAELMTLRGATPDSVTYVVRHEQGPVRIQGDANRSPHGVSIRRQEAAQKILRGASRLSIGKWHEHHLVAGARLAVP
jgi:hypothetical protein